MAEQTAASRRLVGGALICLAMAAAAFLILWWGRGQSFFEDDWIWFTDFRGWSPHNLLRPHSEHLILTQLVLDKSLFATFGAGSILPYRIATVAFHLGSGALVYLIARRRVGPLLAVLPAAIVLFLGSAWEVVNGMVCTSAAISMCAGLGALLCLDRDDLRGDGWASILLLVSLASFSLGVIFSLGVAVELLLGRAGTRWRRAWVFLAPLALYFPWLLWSRQFDAGGGVDLANLGDFPSNLLDSAAATLAGTTGLFRDTLSPSAGTLDLVVKTGPAKPLVFVLIGLVAFRALLPPRVSPRFIALVVMLLVYWGLLALSVGPLGPEGNGGAVPLREPNVPRYVYPGAILVLLLLCEAGSGFRLRRGWAPLLVAASAFAIYANLLTLHDGGRFFGREGEYNRAELAALELARGQVLPDFLPERIYVNRLLPHTDLPFTARKYFSAIDAFGSPAFSLTELDSAPVGPRNQADRVLVHALRVRPRHPSTGGATKSSAPIEVDGVQGGESAARGPCVVLRPSESPAYLSLRVPPGGFRYRTMPNASVTIGLKRFGSSFAGRLPSVRGSAEVRIPADRSRRPWRALLGASAPLTACPLPAPA